MEHAPLASVESYDSALVQKANDEIEAEAFDFLGNELEIDRIPYVSVYDGKDDVIRRGYFIPAFPVTASITSVEKRRGLISRLINPYQYTIELRHGPHQWTVKRRYTDFQSLNNTLKIHRAAARIMAPFQRSLDETLLPYMDGGQLIEIADEVASIATAAPLAGGAGTQIESHEQNGSDFRSESKTRAEEEALLHKSPAETSASWEAAERKTASGNRKVAATGKQKGVESTGAGSTRKGSLPKRAENACAYCQPEISGKVIDKAKRRQMLERDLPDFPTIPDIFISEAKLEERRMNLEHYLREVLKVKAHRDHPETARFLEVSRLSFVHHLGPKDKEGIVEKRPNACQCLRPNAQKCCLTYCTNWRNAWLVVKDSFVALVDQRKERISDVMLFDKNFDVYIESEYPGDRRDAVRNSLFITDAKRCFMLKCDSVEEAIEWESEIGNVTMTRGSVWTDEHRFGGSFPIREGVCAQWLVDGRSYMGHMANVLELAKEEIFIAGFCLSAQIYMKRPIMDDRWRLDLLLKRKADEGVRVFVLLYKEIQKLLPGLGSHETEKYLKSLSPNIKVLRHPDILINPVLLWAHHEKALIVDQKIAFVGGIDPFYGRWDDSMHRLVDLGNEKLSAISPEQIKSEQDEVASVLKRIYGQQSSSHPSPSAGRRLDKRSAEPAQKEETLTVEDVMNMKYTRIESRRSSTISARVPLRLDESGRLWPGKDYQNPLLKDLQEPEKAFEDTVDRTIVPRVPWHDVGCVVYGSVAGDVARHFIQRWNAAKAEMVFNDSAFPFLLPKSYAEMCSVQVPEIFRQMSVACNAQVLRSSAEWSSGHCYTENSILNAYIKMIEESEHYVYIENQFFISSSGGDVKNEVSVAVYNRIVRAHRNNETFRVYIVMPLLPGYLKTSGAMQIELHYTYLTISKGPGSLLEKLKEAVGDPSQYISFCSLRTHAELLGRLVTELVYVHSKMMIVDDRRCLIGSANIDDRSLLGERDSEVVVIIEDTEFSPSVMNGQEFRSGAFARSLRMHLFREYLGLLTESGQSRDEIDVTDPVSSNFYDFWKATAEKNSRIYEQVFACAPTDDVKTLEEWAQKEQNTIPLADSNKEEALEILKSIQGYLVSFPTKFLSESNLLSEKFIVEAWMPSYIFT